MPMSTEVFETRERPYQPVYPFLLHPEAPAPLQPFVRRQDGAAAIGHEQIAAAQAEDLVLKPNQIPASIPLKAILPGKVFCHDELEGEDLLEEESDIIDRAADYLLFRMLSEACPAVHTLTCCGFRGFDMSHLHSISGLAHSLEYQMAGRQDGVTVNEVRNWAKQLDEIVTKIRNDPQRLDDLDLCVPNLAVAFALLWEHNIYEDMAVTCHPWLFKDFLYFPRDRFELVPKRDWANSALRGYFDEIPIYVSTMMPRHLVLVNSPLAGCFEFDTTSEENPTITAAITCSEAICKIVYVEVSEHEDHRLKCAMDLEMIRKHGGIYIPQERGAEARKQRISNGVATDQDDFAEAFSKNPLDSLPAMETIDLLQDEETCAEPEAVADGE